MTPQGLELILDYVTPEKESELIALSVIALKGSSRKSGDCRSRIVRFGYDYSEKEKWIGQIPSWLYYLPGEYNKALPKPLPVNSVTINEYEPGRGILPHFDLMIFSDPILILSLGSHATMRFVYPMGAVYHIFIPARSLMVMGGESRKKWLHSITPDLADTHEGKLLPRQTRYSIVMRNRE